MSASTQPRRRAPSEASRRANRKYDATRRPQRDRVAVELSPAQRERLEEERVAGESDADVLRRRLMA